jgi:hypothetical protein
MKRTMISIFMKELLLKTAQQEMMTGEWETRERIKTMRDLGILLMNLEEELRRKRGIAEDSRRYAQDTDTTYPITEAITAGEKMGYGIGTGFIRAHESLGSTAVEFSRETKRFRQSEQ